MASMSQHQPLHEPSMPRVHTVDSAKRHLAPNESLEIWTHANQEYKLIIDSNDSETGKVVIKKVCKEDETIALQSQCYHDNTERIDVSKFSSEWGDDLPLVPTVLLHCCDDWSAFTDVKAAWTLENLSQRFPDSVVSLDGGPGFARMSMADGRATLSEYCRYCVESASDDLAPLYVFDFKMLASSPDELQKEFRVPPVFSHDVMAGCTGSTFRPLPPQWLLIGAPGSGTPIHDHPTTVAWNALLSGCKLWVLFPPTVDESVLLLLPEELQENKEPKEVTNHDTLGERGISNVDSSKENHSSKEQEVDFDLSAIEWFVNFNTSGIHPEAKVIIQRPKEVVFAPAGWWHVVLNIWNDGDGASSDDANHILRNTSVALSNSLALRRDLSHVFPDLVQSDPDFAHYWAASMVEENMITPSMKDELLRRREEEEERGDGRDGVNK